jgi:hypothetical protein
MKIVIFSKNRAMQLDLCLRSLQQCAQSKLPLNVDVIYTATSYAHQDSYDALIYDHTWAQFIKEKDFKANLLRSVSYTKEVMFLVDDNIFINTFSLDRAADILHVNSRALGFSLRLGRNTKFCYPVQQEQALPTFYKVDDDILMYRWVEAEYDFGYPLEVSSSIYRTAYIWGILENCEYYTPNTLEAVLDLNKRNFIKEVPLMLCYEKSVAFCNPINRVQTFNQNKAGMKEEYSADSLLKEFEKGNRIEYESFVGFVPKAAHQEVDIGYTSKRSDKQLL